MPQMTWHRGDWSPAVPFVTASKVELEYLKKTGVWIAGTSDSSVKSRGLHDCFYNVDSGDVELNAQEAALNKFTKDLSGKVFKQAQESASPQIFLKYLNGEVKKLLSKVESLKGEHEDGTYVTMDDLSVVSNEKMRKFLYEVALAEGMATA